MNDGEIADFCTIQLRKIFMLEPSTGTIIDFEGENSQQRRQQRPTKDDKMQSIDILDMELDKFKEAFTIKAYPREKMEEIRNTQDWRAYFQTHLANKLPISHAPFEMDPELCCSREEQAEVFRRREQELAWEYQKIKRIHMESMKKIEKEKLNDSTRAIQAKVREGLSRRKKGGNKEGDGTGAGGQQQRQQQQKEKTDKNNNDNITKTAPNIPIGCVSDNHMGGTGASDDGTTSAATTLSDFQSCTGTPDEGTTTGTSTNSLDSVDISDAISTNSSSPPNDAGGRIKPDKRPGGFGAMPRTVFGGMYMHDGDGKANNAASNTTTTITPPPNTSTASGSGVALLEETIDARLDGATGAEMNGEGGDDGRTMAEGTEPSVNSATTQDDKTKKKTKKPKSSSSSDSGTSSDEPVDKDGDERITDKQRLKMHGNQIELLQARVAALERIIGDWMAADQ